MACFERGAHDHVDVVHGLGRETRPVPFPGLEEVGVEAVEVLGVQGPDGEVADGGGDVVVDHPPIPMRRRRSEMMDALREARVVHEAGHGRSRACAVAHQVGPSGEVRGDRFGVVAGVAGKVPAAAFLAGGRIETVVGDDVEAVLFGHDVSHHAASSLPMSVDDFGANPKIIRPCRLRRIGGAGGRRGMLRRRRERRV